MSFKGPQGAEGELIEYVWTVQGILFEKDAAKGRGTGVDVSTYPPDEHVEGCYRSFACQIDGPCAAPQDAGEDCMAHDLQKPMLINGTTNNHLYNSR